MRDKKGAQMNPFEVLRLDPSASEAEVVDRAARMRRRAADEAGAADVRQAARALTGRAEERLLHALLTHPRPGHTSPALEKFSAAFRRAPAASGAPPAVPPLGLKEFEGVLKGFLAEELEMTPPHFEALAAAEDPDEARLRMAEALWQSLLFDVRA